MIRLVPSQRSLPLQQSNLFSLANLLLVSQTFFFFFTKFGSGLPLNAFQNWSILFYNQLGLSINLFSTKEIFTDFHILDQGFSELQS